MCGPPRPTKNRPEKILAGHMCPRPFSYLFYVASKPAGSNDHEIDVVIRLHRLPVKAPVGLDRRSIAFPGEVGTGSPQEMRQCKRRRTKRRACRPPTGPKAAGQRASCPIT